jgi:SAM-dependent methyltransferase
MNPLDWLLSQARRPRGWAGRLLVRGMNRAHGQMTDWALSQLSVQDSRALLDIGCGGGAALLRLSELAPQTELHGIDYSPQSLSVAARTNGRLIEQGRVFLREADVSDLPYADGRFDLVVAINSHYFWSDLAGDLREIMRVLQPGGTIALAGGEYFGGKHDTRNRRLASNGRMNCQTLPELRDTLCEAGYSNTEIHEEWKKGWFCVAGVASDRGESGSQGSD